MCSLSNWLTGGGMVAGDGIVQKRETASLHIFSDDSWSPLFEKASSCSICSGSANVAGTLNHICEWYTLKCKNTTNMIRTTSMFQYFTFNFMRINQIRLLMMQVIIRLSKIVCELYLHEKLPCWNGTPNELWLCWTLWDETKKADRTGSGKLCSTCCTSSVQGIARLFGLLYATLKEKQGKNVKNRHHFIKWPFSEFNLAKHTIVWYTYQRLLFCKGNTWPFISEFTLVTSVLRLFSYSATRPTLPSIDSK